MVEAVESQGRPAIFCLNRKAFPGTGRLSEIPAGIAKLRFPDLPWLASWDALGLPPRAYKRLATAVGSPSELSGWTVADLLELPGFGKKSFFLLLAAIERSWDSQCPDRRSAGSGWAPTYTVTREELELATRVGQVPPELFQKRLPAPFRGTGFTALARTPAVQRFLARLRSDKVIRHPEDLGGLTLAELLSHGASARLLLRLMDAIETAAKHRSGGHAIGHEQAVAAAENLIRVPQTEIIRADDIRFGPLICSIAAEATNAAEAARIFLRVADQTSALPDRMRQVYCLDRRIEDALTQTLDRELADIVSVVATGRFQQLAIAVFDWDGGGRRSGPEVAARFQVSRQRVQQICSRIVEQLDGRRPFAPALDRALGLLVTRSGAPVKTLEQQLLSAGIVSRSFALDGILSAASLLGRAVNFRIASIEGEDRLISGQHG